MVLPRSWDLVVGEGPQHGVLGGGEQTVEEGVQMWRQAERKRKDDSAQVSSTKLCLDLYRDRLFLSVSRM